MRIGALYIRVSTDDQVEYSPEAQIRLGLDYAKKNNIIINKSNIFQDDGISGRKAKNRPAFQRMISLAKSDEHPFDIILVWKFSRFARNQEEAIVYKNLLKKSNVEVVSVSEPIPEGFIGDLVQRIFEWMDEYYSINLSGEVKRGMTQRAMAGGYNSDPPLGYKMINGQLTLIPDKAKIVQKIFDLFVDERLSCFDIATRLNALGYTTKRNGKFQNRTVKYILQNEFYIGTIIWNRYDKETRKLKEQSEWIIRENCHEPLIPKEKFETAQLLLSAHTQPRKRPTSTYRHWLSGMLVCSNCGNKLVKAYKSKLGNTSFQCTGYNHAACSVSHMVSDAVLIPAIEQTLKRVLDGGDVTYTCYTGKTQSESNQIEDTKKRINNLDNKEARIKEAYRDGIDTIEEYRQNKEILNKERELLTELLETLQADDDDSTDGNKDVFLKNITSAYDIITNTAASDEMKHNALASVVENIVWDKPNDTLIFNFYLNS